MTNEQPKWHGSDAQRQRVAMLREMHALPVVLPPLPLSFEWYQCDVRELMNYDSGDGKSRWREPYPEEERARD